MKYSYLIILILLMAIPVTGVAQPNQMQGNRSMQSSSSSSNDDDEDPCVDPDDHRNCWTQDPITGIRFIQVPDTSHINLANRQTMAGKSLGLVYTSNLYSPHHISNIFDQRETHDYMFVNAYSLFAYRPEDLLFYDTRIPFTSAAYSTSGTSTQSNDHLKLGFAGNLKHNIGLGTFLDYVYARGEFINEATKPLKWTSYLYYFNDQYRATLTYNISKLANQENGGIIDSTFVLSPEKHPEDSEPHTMSVRLTDTWNDMDSYRLHFNHNYDLGMWREVTNPEDSTDVWDEFTSVASLFHSVDYEHYRHRFVMEANADQTDNKNFFPTQPFFNPKTTNDSSAYESLTTYAGIRLNEGFSKWSQFGISAFVGYQFQHYTMLPKDTLSYEGHPRNHFTHNVFIGGQLSRQLSSRLSFDATLKYGILGDKQNDIDLTGNLQTIIPAGRKDSISLRATGYFRNSTPSYMYSNYLSNNFNWRQDFKQEQHMHIEGNFRYSLTGTEVKVGLEHHSNLIYFDAVDFCPHQSSDLIEVISAEFSQKLHYKAIHFDNRLLLQKSTHEDQLPLPKLVWESDLSLRFVIAHTLNTQLGCTMYYYSKYHAPIYQPATQQFAVQRYTECGNYPLLNAYVNCNLKRLKFYVMYTGFGTNFYTNNVFHMPTYPYQTPRIEYGVVFDLQD